MRCCPGAVCEVCVFPAEEPVAAGKRQTYPAATANGSAGRLASSDCSVTSVE
jgi:hypothetical protein